MQSVLKLTIPQRNEKDEIMPEYAYLIIEADKHGQATVILGKQRILISIDDLKKVATELWIFLKG